MKSPNVEAHIIDTDALAALLFPRVSLAILKLIPLLNWLRTYYGDNLRRLAEVKRAYDPGDMSHFEQSIPVSPPAGATGVKEKKKNG